MSERPHPAIHLTGGAISGMTSCIILQPLDLIKTRIQQSGHRNTIWTTVRHTVQTNGVGGLWRGTLPTILRNVPGTAMYFATLSEIRNIMKWPKDYEKYGNLVSGTIARGSVGYVMMPITVVKVRYESNLYSYKSMSDAFRSIVKYDGVRGLFAGYGATFIRDAPFAGIYLFFYEHWKSIANGWKAAYDLPVANVAVNLGAGVVAGTAATCITQPFDMMKTRMQLNPTIYRHTWDTARKIFLEDGVRGFFDGITLRLARKPLSSAISWAIYEEVVRFFNNRQKAVTTTPSQTL